MKNALILIVTLFTLSAPVQAGFFYSKVERVRLEQRAQDLDELAELSHRLAVAASESPEPSVQATVPYHIGRAEAFLESAAVIRKEAQRQEIVLPTKAEQLTERKVTTRAELIRRLSR